jgi:hypothetical protein
MRQQHRMLKDSLKLYCIWTWDFLVCLFLFFVFFPFDEKMTELLHRHWEVFRTGGWWTNTQIIKTETLLHLSLWVFCFFNFLKLFSLSFLCLSNAGLAYCWLVHYLSLFISLALSFVCLGFFVCLLVFPFFFTFFAFPILSHFHFRYHHCYYYKLENTELHTV